MIALGSSWLSFGLPARGHAKKEAWTRCAQAPAVSYGESFCRFGRHN